MHDLHLIPIFLVLSAVSFMGGFCIGREKKLLGLGGGSRLVSTEVDHDEAIEEWLDENGCYLCQENWKYRDCTIDS